jgi:alkanesulfonate monooxygenase SsuD/methylene tetrahydromethanopterin reductase-like flavin-dependent oxidoreductase (luciferase family)
VTASRPAVGLMLATVADTDTGLIAPDRAVTTARRAEAAGFDGVYLGDHLLHPHPMLESVVKHQHQHRARWPPGGRL